MRPIIHSVKHIVQVPLSAITTASRENILIASAVEGTVANLATEVPEGTIIKAVHVEMWVDNDSGGGHHIAILEKVPNNVNGANFADMGNLFAYTNKKNILFTEQGITPNDGVSSPLPIANQWFKIPKGKQRMGLGDRLVLTLSNVSSQNLNRCGTFIYKEYS